MFSSTQKTWRVLTPLLSAVALLLGLSFAQAASQTWTNAPVNGSLTNINNWVARLAPGANDQFANNVNGDVATFNTPIPGSLIGSAGTPITTADATRAFTATNRCLSLQGFTFDTANCGAYVFSNTDALNYPGFGYLNLCMPANNGIPGLTQMTSTVTNSQMFMTTILIRLPASTAGQYNFKNDAAVSSATMFLASVTNDSANTRGTVFIFSGANTGTNTVAALGKGATTSGAMGITKTGSGHWMIPNGSDIAAQSVNTIDNGILEVGNVLSLGAPTNTTVTTNGILQIDGVTLNQTALTLSQSGTVRMNGTATINGINVASTTGMTPIVATTSASDVLTLGNAIGKVTRGALDSVLHFSGPGTIALTFSNTYIGKYSIDSGTNLVTDAGGFGPAALVSVSAGGIIDLRPLGAVSLPFSAFGIGGKGTGTAVGTTAATILPDPGAVININGKSIALTFTPTTFIGSDTTHPALFLPQGTLSMGNNAFTVNNAGSPLDVGTYRLIQQNGGSIIDGGGYVVAVTGSGTVFGTLGQIQVSGGNVNLVVANYTAKDLVWKGGNPNNNWDVSSTSNFLNGATASVFNTSDRVIFNATGSSVSNVNITTTVIPGAVTVDASVTNYTFSGIGQIAGTTGLSKIGANGLIISTVNSYSGNTVISNGFVRLGTNNALPNQGSGTVSLYSPAILDMNTFSNSIGGLTGNGTVDTVAGGAAALTLGANDTSGNFSGHIQNTAGSLSLMKLGIGAQTISSANSFTGGTVVNNGTLRVGNFNALGTTNNLVVNNGILDIQTDLNVTILSGAGGGIENDSTPNLNTLVIQSPTNSSTTYSGVIADGSGGGSVAVKLLSGTLSFAGGNTYTGGTYVGSGANFGIPNSPAGVIGFLVASNNANLALSGGSGTPGTPTNVLTVDGATVTFTSGALGKIWGAQFVGSANTTNRYLQAMSFGGDSSFKNFNGIVNLEMAGNARFINIPAASTNNNGYGGGDAAIFNFALGGTNAAAMTSRDPATIRLGEIRGGSFAAGIDSATTAGAIDTYIIGGKNTSFAFEGFIRGSNNIVKVGTGTMTIDAQLLVSTNSLDSQSDPVTNNVLSCSMIYGGNTVVSNGVLRLIAPNNVSSNSPIVTMAGSAAVLDVSSAGYPVNQIDVNNTDPFPGGLVTNFFAVTNGTLSLAPNGAGPGQILNGFGTINGRLLAPLNSIVTPGLPFGTLTVTTNATLNGLVTVNISTTNTPNCGELASPVITVGGTASLIVTNLGPENGATFQLFNHAVSFTSVTLPPTTGTNSWVNNLAVNGSITLLAPPPVTVNTNPFPMSAVLNGNSLALSWPPDRLGFRLQTQTNSLSSGISTNWVDVAGSGAATNATIIINPLNPTVFYRLIYP